jgi:hypothetical protein
MRHVNIFLCLLGVQQAYSFPAELEERAACNKDNLLNAFTNPTHSAEASTFCSAYISVPLTSTSTYLGPVRRPPCFAIATYTEHIQLGNVYTVHDWLHCYLSASSAAV